MPDNLSSSRHMKTKTQQSVPIATLSRAHEGCLEWRDSLEGIEGNKEGQSETCWHFRLFA